MAIIAATISSRDLDGDDQAAARQWHRRALRVPRLNPLRRSRASISPRLYPCPRLAPYPIPGV